MTHAFDFVVIGGGMAGVAVAAQLSLSASVRLLEMEPQPGYHSTGRSAAVFAQTYGNSVVRALTRASKSFFFAPETGFCAAPLVKPRAVLVTARRGREATLEAFIGSIEPGDVFERKSAGEALGLCPILKADELAGAVLSRSPADIEVHEVLQGYLRMFRRHNGVITTGARVVGLQRNQGQWEVETTRETLRANVIVNAAGAWAGEVAKLAGAGDVGLRPLKRTACLIEPPLGEPSNTWPMLVDVEEQYYLKPDAGMLLLSPVDETLTPPCDAQADELDIAVAVDRIERATTLNVKRIVHRWAGLRSFVEDRSPVVGFDPIQPGFFWLAALGGFGIQTAPALSRLAAALARQMPVAADLLECGVDSESVSPGRLRVAKSPVT